MPPVGYEPTISAGERPQTHALDCAATGTGRQADYENKTGKIQSCMVFFPNEPHDRHIF